MFHPLTASEFVERALSQRGVVTSHGVGTYHLDGGAEWQAESCYSDAHNLAPGQCDCSGFLAWAGNWADPGRGPWNTNAIVDDARKARTHFALVPHTEEVKAGHIIVKAGPDLDHDGKRDHPGHCGIITSVIPGFRRGVSGWWEHLLVTHCSGARQLHIDPSTGKCYGAVRTTDASLWGFDGYIIAPLHVEYPL